MSFQFRIARAADEATVELGGSLDENARDPLFALKAKLAGAKAVTFDLGAVGRINSIGVGTWINFVRTFPQGSVQYVNCSVVFMDFATMVPLVRQQARILSFHAPFHCAACDEEVTQVLAAAARPVSTPCPKCGAPAAATGFLLDLD